MSTVERIPPRTLPPLVAGQHLGQPTFHERYEAMPPDTRAELVGGVVYMPSPMRLDHGKWDHPVAAWLARYEQFTPGVEGASPAGRSNAMSCTPPGTSPPPDMKLPVNDTPWPELS